MTEQVFVQEFRPTIWHRLGFGYAAVASWHGDQDEDANYCCTDVVAVLDWRDRLRLVLTGRLSIAVRVRTQHDAGRVEGRSAVKVMGWGWQR